MKSTYPKILAAIIVTLSCAFQGRAAPDSFEDGVEAYNEKNYAKAIDHFTQAMQDFPNNFALYLWRAQAYLGANDYDKAQDDYAQAISLNPLDPDGYIGRGATFLWKKDYDKALADYSKAVELDSNNSRAYD